MNQQFISVTQARAEFRTLLESVSKDGREVVLLKDSQPEAVIVPYKRFMKIKDTENMIWESRFNQYLAKARAIGKAWAKKRGINPKKMTEAELYEEIEKA